MMDKNESILVGRVASKIKEGKTQRGDSYIWFSLDIEAKANATSTDNNYHQSINIMCFKKPVIDYVKRVNMRIGCTVVVFGFVSSFIYEFKGKNIATNAINGNEIYVVKTRRYEDEIGK